MNLNWIIGDVIGNWAGITLHLAIWVTALVLSSVLLKKSTCKPALFLVIGSSLLLVGAIISELAGAIADYAQRSSESGDGGVAALRIAFLSPLLFGVPGVVCIFWGVWKKFNERAAVTGTKGY